MHRITSIASVMSLLAVSGFAQGSFGPTGGQNLFSIGGALSKEDINPSTGGSASFTTFNAQLGFGRFLTDVHEVGVQLNESYSTSDVSGVSDSISTGIAPYYNYNFRSNPRTWFYVGAHLGAQITDQGGTSDTNFAYGVHGGVRHWLSQTAAIFAEPRYTVSQFDGGDFTTTEIIFGYSVVL